MTVIRLVLGDENEIWFALEVLKIRDGRFSFLFGVGEDGIQDD
jgi:hypothetical protein